MTYFVWLKLFSFFCGKKIYLSQFRLGLSDHREIDVIQWVQMIEIHKCQGLIGLHHLTGTEWEGKFAGRKTWVKAYMALDDNRNWLFQRAWSGSYPKPVSQPRTANSSKRAGEICLPIVLQSGTLRSRNLEGEMLPQTRTSLLPYTTRAKMTAANTNGYTFPLCAYVFLHPKRLLSLLNAAASQNARDAVAVSRTDLHTLLFVNVLETTVPIHSKMTHGLIVRKRMMML